MQTKSSKTLIDAATEIFRIYTLYLTFFSHCSPFSEVLVVELKIQFKPPRLTKPSTQYAEVSSRRRPYERGILYKSFNFTKKTVSNKGITLGEYTQPDPQAWVTIYYGGLKFVPLGFKRLVILQSVDKVKLKLSSCFTRVRFVKKKHDDKSNFTLSTDCRITNLLNPRGTNFSPP